MKKLISLVLALAMILMVGAAFAGTITINRDDSWNTDADAANATYTPYKVFDAIITSAGSVDADTGELTTVGNVVYTVGTEALANVVNATTTLKAELASDGKYYISRKGTPAPTDAAVLADIEAMVNNNPSLFPAGTAVTADTAVVTLTVATDGYYLIKASNGKDAIVQTIGNVEIKEKNDYPTIDKKQKKATGQWTDDPIPEEVGSVIEYKITVHIPEDATKAIKVFDTMTAGLTYNDDLAEANSIPYTALPDTDAAYDSNATFQIVFSDTTVIAHRGEDIVLTYSATVNTAAITDSGKENEVTLIYDNGNYVLTDEVHYEIYFGGIYKVDPNDANANMAGVTFDLKDGDGNAVNVTYDTTNGYYKVDPASTSNEVETRAETATIEGVEKTFYTIKIRGLDDDKDYTLTETATKAGYNLLNGTVTLTKTLDQGQAFSTKVLNTFDQVQNQKGTQLPSTGGIGTTIFYILGGLLVVGAAVILVARRKAHD